MLHPRIRCIELVESVTDWMEGTLDDDTRVELEEHLAMCIDCMAYVDQLRFTAAVLQATERDADGARGSSLPPPAVQAALLDAFRRSRAT